MLEVRAWGARAADDAAMTGGIKLHSGARETIRKRTGHERLKSPVVEMLHITVALFRPRCAAEQNRHIAPHRWSIALSIPGHRAAVLIKARFVVDLK
jgi:hypothetical protein